MSLVDNCALLPEIKVMMDVAWADNRTKADIEPHAETAVALIDNTTATLTDLKGAKDRQVQLQWLDYCDAGTTDCTTNCDITPDAEVRARCVTYELTQCFESNGFKVAEKDLRDKPYETQQMIALGLAKDAKAMDETWAAKSVDALNTYVGVNVADVPGFTVSSTVTNVPPALWTPNMFGQLELTAKLNKFSAPVLISGQNLYLANWNAQMDTATPENQNAKKRMGIFPIYFDIWNLDTANSGVKKTYMMQKGALAFVTKAYEGKGTMASPNKLPRDTYSWTMASPTLPGVFYDVFYQYTCVGNEYFHSFKLQTKGDILENPLGCDPTNTGIIDFTCAA